MLKSQKDKVEYQLNTRGFVSRNWSIYHQPRSDGGITRLSSIIKTLRQEGMILNGRKADVGFGKNDFVYYLEEQQTLI